MPKTVKGKSGRKPLSNISNSVYLSQPRKSSAREAHHKNNSGKDECDGGSLGRLHAAHSSLSRLINQIDGLVVHAHKLNLAHKLVECDMECFIRVLLEMHLTLQAWLPKFEQASSNLSATVEKQRAPSSPPVSSSAPKEENLISLDDPATKTLEPSLSPSPLVSWPACIKNDSERELFCLTPMPVSRAFSVRSKVFPALQLTKPADKGEFISMVKTPLSTFQNPNESPLQMEVMTPQIPQSLVSKYSNCKLSDSSSEDPSRNSPGFEMSPPKTCLLLRPLLESLERGQDNFIESTPLNVRLRKFDETPSSEELESQIPKSLMTKYPELFRKAARDSVLPSTQLQTSPCFAISPPKSCVLLMPPSEVPLNSQGDTEILKPHERDKISTSSNFSITFSPSVYCTEPRETEAAIGQEKITEKILIDNHPVFLFEASPDPLLNSKVMHIKSGVEESMESSCVETFISGGIQKDENSLSDVTEPCENTVSVLSVMATPETPFYNNLMANTEQIVRQPGEQTLRRELWSKLEEESADMPCVFPEVRKDVLSMLDEMSLETNSRINSISQLQSLHKSIRLKKGGNSVDENLTLGTLSTGVSLHSTKGFHRSCLGDKLRKEGSISTPDPTMRDQQEKCSESYSIWKTTASNCKISRLTKIDHVRNKASGMLLRAKKTCAHLKTSER